MMQSVALTGVETPLPEMPGPTAAAAVAESAPQAAVHAAVWVPAPAEAEQVAATIDGDTGLGLFFALRWVLAFYVGAGILAALGYEFWCLLAR